MFSRLRLIKDCGIAHMRAERSGGIGPTVHSVLAVFSSKEPHPRPSLAGDGVSTYLALIFGTLLSSQGTDASFVLTRETLSGFPPGASLRSCVSDSIRPFPVPISSVLSRFPLPRFPFRRFRLYQILSALIPRQSGVAFPAVGPFRRLKP